MSSLPGQDTFDGTSNLSSLVVLGCWTFSIIPCIIELFTRIATAWWKKGIYTIKPTIRVEEQYLPSPTFISVRYVWIPGVKHLKCFAVLHFFKSTQLSSDKGQEHRNADFFFILEKDVMSLSIYAEISGVLNIFHCGKLNHGSNFFYWLQSQS